MRKINRLLLLIASIFFFFNPFLSNVASADELISGYTNNAYECGTPVITDEADNALEDYKKNDANMAEKFLTNQSQNLFNIGDINGISSLIFGNPYCVWADTDGAENPMSSNGIFTQNEMEKVVEPMINLLGSVFVIVVTIALLISGLKIMSSSLKGRAMADFWNDAGWMVIAIILGLFYYEFINIFFQMNAALVSSIGDLIKSISGDALQGFSVMSSVTDFISAGTIGSFLFVILGEWILSGILNIIYIARKVVILLLLIMGIVALYSLMFAKTRAFFSTWLKELIGNIFLQSIHAIVLFAVIQFVELGAGVFFKLVLMMMFIPVSGMISKWLNFGDSSSSLGSALTMVGLGGAMTTMMMASQASNIMRGGSMNGGSSFSSISGGPGGGNGGGGGLTQLANSVANDTSATSIAMRAQGSSDSTVFNAIKGAGGKLGTFAGGIGGMVAGPAGAALFSRAGNAVGQGIPQVARNVAVGASSMLSSVSGMKNFSGANGESGFKGLFGKNSANNFESLNARRQSMSNMGESLGVMLGGQKGAAIGRSLGAALSGASRSSLNELNSQGVSKDFDLGARTGAVSFAELAQKHPNADAKWVQTNQGSSFLVNSGDGFKQVGVTGAADGMLKDGQARVMDFKLGDQALNYAVQPNGTYKPDKDLYSASMSDRENSSNFVPSFSSAVASGGMHSTVASSNSMEGTAPSITFANEAVASQIIATPSPAAVGLQGSTPEVMRTSDAYIVSGVNHKSSNAVANASSSGTTVKVQDASFQPKTVNPDAYVFQGTSGSQVSGSDRVANNVKATGAVASKWASKVRDGREKRQSKTV